MTRQNANQGLIDILQHLIDAYPDLRFSQILYVYGFIQSFPEIDKTDWKNEFYTESSDILKRVSERLYE